MEQVKQLDKVENDNLSDHSEEPKQDTTQEENSELSGEQTDNDDEATDSDNGTDDDEDDKPFNSETDIVRWKPSLLTKDKKSFRGLILGSTGTGKSHMLHHLLNKENQEDFDFIYIISKSEYTLDEYRKSLNVKSEIMYFKCYFNEISEPLNNRINLIHMDLLKEPFKFEAKSLIIIDDCLDINKDRNNKDVIDLWTNSRKRNISIIYMAQSPKFITNEWIDNASWMILFNLGSGINRKKLIDKTITGLGGLNNNEWEKIILKNCKGHQSIVMDLEKRNNNPHDMIKKYSV